MMSSRVRVDLLLLMLTLSVVLPALAPRADGQNNSIPLINQPLVPATVEPGGSDFTLTVNGTGFVPGSMVNWNGNSRPTTFITQSQLTATISASDVAVAGSAWITVTNPQPGGGTSNLAAFEVSNPNANLVFAKASYAVGAYVAGMAAADVNLDGNLDLITANVFANTVSVLLGNGDGTFQPPVTYSTGPSPWALAIGDLNGDGEPDIVTTDINCPAFPCPNGLVSVLLGNGDGTFKSHEDFDTGGIEPGLVTLADFNGDGNLDAAVVVQNCPALPCTTDGFVSILLGNGDGSFQPHADYETDIAPISIAVGDVDGDGILDLAVANDNCSELPCPDGVVSILLGNGDGTFKPQMRFDTDVGAYSVALADLNADGKLDLASANLLGRSISVLRGNGDGTFQSHVDYATGFDTSGLLVNDFDGNGTLDLGVWNIPGSSIAFSVLSGNGHGTFGSPVNYSYSSDAPIAADLNRDGRIDLAGSNNIDNSISVYLQVQNATATLSPTVLTFPAQVVKTQSNAQIVTLTNTGNVPISITSITTSPEFPLGAKCGKTLAVGASCTIQVMFKPSGTGTRTGTLTITDNASGSPQTVALTGTGTFFGLSSSSLSFGNVSVGTTSQPQTVILTNHAFGSQKIYFISLGGANPKQFAETNNCPSSLAAGASCNITVTFSPTGKGAKSATLQIGGGGATELVALTGTGT